VPSVVEQCVIVTAPVKHVGGKNEHIHSDCSIAHSISGGKPFD